MEPEHSAPSEGGRSRRSDRPPRSGSTNVDSREWLDGLHLLRPVQKTPKEPAEAWGLTVVAWLRSLKRVRAARRRSICVVVAHLAESCSNSLSRAEPVTFTAAWSRPGEPAHAYGVALDGVRSISFETKPLDAPPGFGGLIVAFDNGTTQTIR